MSAKCGIFLYIPLQLISMRTVSRHFLFNNPSKSTLLSAPILSKSRIDRPSILFGVGTPAIARMVGAMSRLESGLWILEKNKNCFVIYILFIFLIFKIFIIFYIFLQFSLRNSRSSNEKWNPNIELVGQSLSLE